MDLLADYRFPNFHEQFVGRKFWRFLWVDLLADYRFPKKIKFVISDVTLCVCEFYMVICTSYTVEFQLFSTLHCSWCVSEYKSGPWFTIVPQVKIDLLFVCGEVLRPSQSHWVMSSAGSLPNYTFTGQA